MQLLYTLEPWLERTEVKAEEKTEVNAEAEMRRSAEGDAESETLK